MADFQLFHRYRRQASSHIDRVDPEGFAQNIDPERYLPESNRLKDALQQLAAFKQVTITPAPHEKHSLKPRANNIHYHLADENFFTA
ncbi:hypothetical protein [Pseudomonas sp. FP2338]|uniref:hypothetical protein n=1 Tax=Pseudomonas sp. FP2338 TaxID=2954093 RepID=UPI0027370007|nr:hypothetical protein [Pseudomonas sp. FP2338]WLH82596.1 hypothetical protein PSH96_17300 [Pseudomonas sp. FP2338]